MPLGGPGPGVDHPNLAMKSNLAEVSPEVAAILEVRLGLRCPLNDRTGRRVTVDADEVLLI